MKFSLESKQVVLPSSTESTPTVESISYAYEGLLTSYMELTDAQKNLGEVCQVMENIELSMKMLQCGSTDAVKLLNIDGSLENLCGIEAKLLTVEKAQEGLGEAASNLAKQFIEKCKKFFSAVHEWLSKIIDVIVGETSNLKRAKETLETELNNTASVDEIDAKIANEAQKESAKESLAALESSSAAYFEYASLFDKSKYTELANYIKVNFSLEPGMFKDLQETISRAEKWSDQELTNALNRPGGGNPHELNDYNSILKKDYKGKSVRPYDVGFKSHSDIKEILRPTGEVISTSDSALKVCRTNLAIFKKNLSEVGSMTSLRPALQKYLVNEYQFQVKLLNQCIVVLRMNIRVFAHANTELTKLLRRATRSAE